LRNLAFEFEQDHPAHERVARVRFAARSQQQPPRSALAITGGTGASKTAHGQVRIVDLNATDSRLTLTLIR
jgi:hypothetical protein